MLLFSILEVTLTEALKSSLVIRSFAYSWSSSQQNIIIKFEKLSMAPPSLLSN
jgi:hypothetical protein